MAKPRLGTSNPLATALTEAEARIAPPRRTTFSLSEEVAERARDVAYYQRMRVVEVVETAIREYADRLEQERGEPFALRPRRGRRRR